VRESESDFSEKIAGFKEEVREVFQSTEIERVDQNK